MDSLLSCCSSSNVQRWNYLPTLTLCRCYGASQTLLRAYRQSDQRRSIRLYTNMEDRGREKLKPAILGAYRPLNDWMWTISPAMSEFDLCFPTRLLSGVLGCPGRYLRSSEGEYCWQMKGILLKSPTLLGSEVPQQIRRSRQPYDSYLLELELMQLLSTSACRNRWLRKA
jgi:hypothetical protein